MQPTRIVDVRDKLRELGASTSEICLGQYDAIGEYTAKKARDPNSELYRKVGCFFRPNYERGILINTLIARHGLSSMLEIGFGRGYAAVCAAMMFAELGGDGMVMSVEPNLDQKHMNALTQVFPKQWLERIKVAQGRSQDVLPRLQDSYDIVFVDGDHRKESVRADWEGVKDRWSCFCLFDDWQMDPGTDPEIQVHEALSDVELPSHVTCELIVGDRRIFLDDRGLPDDQIRYGQLLLTNTLEVEKRSKETSFKETWDW